MFRKLSLIVLFIVGCMWVSPGVEAKKPQPPAEDIIIVACGWYIDNNGDIWIWADTESYGKKGTSYTIYGFCDDGGELMFYDFGTSKVGYDYPLPYGGGIEQASFTSANIFKDSVLGKKIQKAGSSIIDFNLYDNDQHGRIVGKAKATAYKD